MARLVSENPRALSTMLKDLESPGGPNDRPANRQANAAIALFCLGRPESAWKLLGASSDPSVRDLLIRRMVAFGVDRGALFDRLQNEPDPTARQAILLALGEPSADAGGMRSPAETLERRAEIVATGSRGL
jgi:hypothetical protein